MSGRFRVRGRVDFSAPAHSAFEPQAANGKGLRAIHAPGIDIEWDPNAFDVASLDGVVAIATSLSRSFENSVAPRAIFSPRAAASDIACSGLI